MNENGDITGHSDVVVERPNSFDQTELTSSKVLAFFEMLNERS
jgi:hypothetical protein